MADAVIAEMGDVYPEIRENRAFILKVAEQEEESFRRTLDKGLTILEEQIRHLTARGEKTIPGKVAFQLYDTFGFPMDLTRVIAEEHAVGVDEAGFETAMAEQRARSEWKGSGEEAVEEIHRQIANELAEVRFLGYDATAGEGADQGPGGERKAGRPGRQGRPGRGDHLARPRSTASRGARWATPAPSSRRTGG